MKAAWLLLAAACSTPVESVVTAAVLRDEARLELEGSCGDCHISHYPTALPGALAVFDLAEPEWAQRLSKAQLADVAARMGNAGAVRTFSELEIARLCALP